VAIKDRLICLARDVRYRVTEPLMLRYERLFAGTSKPDTWEYHGRAYFSYRPRISVYIPTHNRANLLLSRALPSVMAQDYRNFEIIVAAHGCTDDTAEKVLTAYPLGKEPSVWVVNVPRTMTYPATAENHWLAGPVVPANAALGFCGGEWIARIDDDDEWTPDHLSQLMAFAVKTDAEFVSAAHETHEGPVEPYGVRGNKVGGTQTWLYRSYLKFFKYNPDCWRKTWNRVNDTDLQDRMARAGVRMKYLNRVVARVLPRPGTSVVGLRAYTQNSADKERELSFAG